MSNSNLVVRNAEIIWRNFRGEGTDYNNAGKRNFNLLITDPDFAQELIDDGWNVKAKKKRDESEPDKWTLKVNVVFGKRPPNIYIVTYPNGKMKKTRLEEENIAQCDWVEIQKLDLIIRPWDRTTGPNPGRSAYLDTMYLTPLVDELAQEYLDDDFTPDDECPFE